MAFLTGALAFTANARAQNAPNDTRQTPTIEDRIGQLEQNQEDLTGRVDALDQKIISLQKQLKLSGQKAGESAGMASQASDSSDNKTNGTQGASYDVFYDRLQSDGQWSNDETYGYVWQPNTASTDQNWRPYTDGRWVYTDRGWTWISNEKFGWATYHYGRWARLSDRGWVWIPGDQWAPAWVSWRESDDYVGWAPLPPEAESEQDIKIQGWADNYYDIGPTAYVFLRTTDLGNQNYRDFIASPRDNVDFISRTKNVTNIYDGRDGIIDGGPNYDQLVQRSKVKIDQYRLNYVQQNSAQAQFGATVRGDQLQVLAPSPRLQREATVEPKIASNIANSQVDRGWQNVNAATAKQLKQTWEKQAPVPTTLPQKPEPPKPVVANAATRQGQQAGAGNREPNKPSATTQQAGRTQDTEATAPTPNEKAAQLGQQPPPADENRHAQPNQGQRAETAPPAPTPSGNEKAAHSGQQPPAVDEHQPQEPNRGQRVETTPPAPTPSQKDRAVQRPEPESTSANQTERQESRDVEKAQATPKRSESLQSKNDRPAQSEEKSDKVGNSEQGSPSAASGSNEKRSDRVPQKAENTTHQQRTNEELPASEEGRRREGESSQRKSNSDEPARGLSEEKKGPGRDQSGDAKSNNKKRPEEPEKKKVEPSGPQ
jgi:uncharacterized protein DUF6600